MDGNGEAKMMLDREESRRAAHASYLAAKAERQTAA
jgi:hypothetical protein